MAKQELVTFTNRSAKDVVNLAKPDDAPFNIQFVNGRFTTGDQEIINALRTHPRLKKDFSEAKNADDEPTPLPEGTNAQPRKEPAPQVFVEPKAQAQSASDDGGDVSNENNGKKKSSK